MSTALGILGVIGFAAVGGFLLCLVMSIKDGAL